MKRFCCSIALALAGLAGTAQAEPWMFMPSYYSHDPVKPVRIQRQYSRGPVFIQQPGMSVNTGYRFLRSQINVGGGTYDQINMWDSWIQGRDQVLIAVRQESRAAGTVSSRHGGQCPWAPPLSASGSRIPRRR